MSFVQELFNSESKNVDQIRVGGSCFWDFFYFRSTQNLVENAQIRIP